MRTLTRACLILLSILILPDLAQAVERCRARVASDGTVKVSAKNVSGSLRYGFSSTSVAGLFSNQSKCIEDGRASNCTLGAKQSLERVTPPPACVLYMEDSNSSCEARLDDCVPGMRPLCPPDMERLGAGCIDRQVTPGLEFGPAVNSCVARGRNLCTVPELMACDSANVSSARTGSCGSATDGGSWLYSLGTNSEDGSSVFSRLVIYRDDNLVREQSSGSGGIYDFFCCAALGTP